jgi:hypothetical protein
MRYAMQGKRPRDGDEKEFQTRESISFRNTTAMKVLQNFRIRDLEPTAWIMAIKTLYSAGVTRAEPN